MLSYLLPKFRHKQNNSRMRQMSQTHIHVPAFIAYTMTFVCSWVLVCACWKCQPILLVSIRFFVLDIDICGLLYTLATINWQCKIVYMLTKPDDSLTVRTFCWNLVLFGASLVHRDKMALHSRTPYHPK